MQWNCIQWNYIQNNLYSVLERLFLNLKELFGASVVSLTKKEYGSKVHFLWILMKYLVLISDE